MGGTGWSCTFLSEFKLNNGPFEKKRTLIRFMYYPM